MSLLKTQNEIRGQEPPMYIQRPTAGHSQDVRHILARNFRDLYTRDTIRLDTVQNLRTSKGGEDSYHERYVENLQTVYSEWRRRMDEVAMLERHIMQAQARAMSADERALNKATKSCDQFDSLGLPPGRAHFKSCIDTDLLRKHNLLVPSDYMAQEPLSLPAPKEETCCECWEELRTPELPDYARETLASQQHSRPNTQHLVTSPRSAGIGDSEDLPTLLSDEDIQNMPVQKSDSAKSQLEFPKKVGWKEFLSEEQREIDRRDLDMVNAKVNFLKNPRFVPPENVKSLIKPIKKKNKEAGLDTKQSPPSPVIFVPHPAVVEFTDYKLGEVYETILELKNMSSVMRQCRVLPPSSSIFYVGLGQFPGENGLVAPGMSCKYKIRFSPNSLMDYDDSITVQSQGFNSLVVPLRARRPPPVLTLPKEIDLGCCLVGDVQVTHLIIKNEGGSGRFCVMNKNKWPSTSFRALLTNLGKMNAKHSTFLIVPTSFELLQGQTILLEIYFSPQSAKNYLQEVILTCDNCHATQVKIKGEGQHVKVGVLEDANKFSEPLVGELKDVTAQHLLKFDDLNPFTYTEKKITIKNFTKVEVPFQWVFYKPIIQAVFDDNSSQVDKQDLKRVQDMSSVFSVHPPCGILKPLESADFSITFAPPKEDHYHSTAHLILEHIPYSKDFGNISEEERMKSWSSFLEEEGAFLQHGPGGATQSTDITCAEIEVKGNCVPLNVVLHPYAIILQPSALIGTTIKRLFTMANHSFSTISFQWDSYVDEYIIQVEPPYGELDPGMAMDLEISITGDEVGLISHTLYCHVIHLHEPLPLYIQAEFNGPELKILEPLIFFGLVKVGQSAVMEMTILNTSEMKTNFTITEIQQETEDIDEPKQSDLRFSAISGEIRPLERKTIQLSFSPRSVQHLKTICEVKCERGNTSFIGVQGEAQNPVVCFLECTKTLEDVYLDVPVVFQAVLHNQTLLCTKYRWGQVEGNQKDFCSVEVDDVEGKVLSWEQKPITIRFTAFKPLEFTDLRIPCCIESQDEKLFLNIICIVKTLSVSYKVSTDKTDVSEDLQLHFGDNVQLGQPVKRHLHIFNQTAIPAHFKISAEYFAAASPPHEDTSGGATAQSNRRALLARTPNIADPMSKTPEKIQKDFNKLVLGGKKGAAFVPYPTSGHLKPFEEEIIEITIFNDMWGTYTDSLKVEIGDLETMLIPMKATVVGCPLHFQLTAGQPDLKAIVRFGSHTPRSKAIQRKLKVNNTSPFDIRVNWEILEATNSSEQLIDFITCFGECFPAEEKKEVSEGSLPVLRVSSSDFSLPSQSNRSVSDTLSNRPDVLTCFIRPHEGVPIKEPFAISPRDLIVPGYGCSFMILRFTPGDVVEEVNFNGIAKGYLTLDKEIEDIRVSRLDAYNVDHLKLETTATITPPLLTVEEVDEDGLVINAVMCSLVKDGKIMENSLSSSSVMLTNNTLSKLTFQIKVKKPFLLVDLHTDSAVKLPTEAMKTTYCALKPGSHIMVKVGLNLSQSILSDNTAVKIDQTLELRSTLSITFDNGTRQTVPVLGAVAVPQFELSTCNIEFEHCLVGQTRFIQFTLYNTSTSDSYWRIQEEHKGIVLDETVFQVNPSEGILPAQIDNLSNNKTLITVSFTPKHSECYNVLFQVVGMLGEVPRSLLVTGFGSYDGKYEAILNV